MIQSSAIYYKIMRGKDFYDFKMRKIEIKSLVSVFKVSNIEKSIA